GKGMQPNEHKKLKEFSPEEVLLSTDGIENVAKKYEEKRELRLKLSVDVGILVAAVVNLIFNIISVAMNFSQMRLWNKIVTIILVVAIGIYVLAYLIKVLRNLWAIKRDGEALNLGELLIEKVREKLKYTAIIRVVYKEDGILKYLIDDESFLPYSYMDREKTVDEQKDTILESLYSKFHFSPKSVIDVKPVDGVVYFSIKPVHNKLQMNAFAFYDIEIKEQEKDKLLADNSSGKWVTIEDMKNDAKAFATNQDVIHLLEKLPSPIDSFRNMSGDIRIIWNIASKCSYNCAICATYDPDRRELLPADKLKVLHNVYSVKDRIKNIYFAGGEPLMSGSREVVDIIRTAIIMFGDERISVTTTGSGISASTFPELRNVIKHCELTIDAAHEDVSSYVLSGKCSISRDSEQYCNDNLEQMNLLLANAESLTINMPIINDDLEECEIDRLIQKILDIKGKHPDVKIDVTLLRLMPVGKMRGNTTPDRYKQYNPIPVAKSIKAKLENHTINCKLHCSLRLLSEFNNDSYCTMFEKKLGIDCAGNVFACAWGGYLGGALEENPFYLGNLVQTSLEDIIRGNGGVSLQQYMNIKAEQNLDPKERKYCRVVSHYVKGTPFQNNDPLAKK
ncbi:MAG: radical SAM/SPASM domain-containing protein, partial [Clostridiales bacterium]|nr:radical SAM/SPASM domain-containing protein [Clostridiales bacterium]